MIYIKVKTGEQGASKRCGTSKENMGELDASRYSGMKMCVGGKMHALGYPKCIATSSAQRGT